MRQLAIAGMILLATCGAACGAPLIVETDPLPPDEQRAQFHLPPGFVIELVASEPDIGQPMNLNFDAAGRLWVTHSVEYPYPARGEGIEPRDARFPQIGDHDPRDKLSVIEGIGTPAQRITHFAEGLNIPIGQLPLPRGAIVFSIPNIWFCPDDDGDLKADRRDLLYGTFGNVDTHGMAASFTRWLDGWIYGTHGFRNTSRVRGSDGHEITMNSGNTYRFRSDGSRIEQVTWGQVNPFGLTFDPWGNAYTADCHSMPLTCLIREAYYSSFGKPHDGLGFGPDMIDHIHGSTGICGAAWYAAPQFPPEYRDCIYLCNPVNGQVHRDRIEFRGSSPWAVTQPDFLTCDDGWFRPVDVKLGPDGALYVADFYNSIIGHYEVALDHPRRDRDHGRIWRIRYLGEAAAGTAPGTEGALPDLTACDVPQLIELSGEANLALRLLAAHQLFDRYGAECVEPCSQLIVTSSDPGQITCAAWLIERIESLSAPQLAHVAGHSSPVVRTHAARILAERRDWTDCETSLAPQLLDDAHPMVRRAAADALGRHPRQDFVAPLLAALEAVEPGDSHLRHTLRIALRNHVREDSIARSPQLTELLPRHAARLADVALGAPTESAAALVFAALEQGLNVESQHADFLRHVARYARLEQVDALIARLAGAGTPPSTQYRELLAVVGGLEARNISPREHAGDWAAALTREFLAESASRSLDWMTHPVPGRAYEADAFAVESRDFAGGSERDLFFCTRPRGERKTGILRSDPFVCPGELTFYLAGQDGWPEQPPRGLNAVRLRRDATGELLREAPAPRDDLAQRVEWDLSVHQGEAVRLEIVDADASDGYAWIAAGRFSIDALNPRAFSAREAAADLIVRLRLRQFAPPLRDTVADRTAPLAARLRWSDTLLYLDPDARLRALLDAASAQIIPPPLAERVLNAIVSRDEHEIDECLVQSMRLATGPQQWQLAERLSADRRGAEALLRLVGGGLASPRLLLDPRIAEKLRAGVEDAAERIAALVEGLPEPAEEIEQLIAERRQSLVTDGTSPERGRALFRQHCAACHQLGSEGKKVGPALDGIGLRGADRLLEDILDPSRNVDAAFRTTAILTTDGQVVSGLLVREEGATVILVDNKGQEFSIPKDSIEEQSVSGLSLMPGNWGEVLPMQDLNELVAELLRQTQPVTASQ